MTSARIVANPCSVPSTSAPPTTSPDSTVRTERRAGRQSATGNRIGSVDRTPSRLLIATSTDDMRSANDTAMMIADQANVRVQSRRKNLRKTRTVMGYSTADTDSLVISDAMKFPPSSRNGM